MFIDGKKKLGVYCDLTKKKYLFDTADNPYHWQYEAFKFLISKDLNTFELKHNSTREMGRTYFTKRVLNILYDRTFLIVVNTNIERLQYKDIKPYNVELCSSSAFSIAGKSYDVIIWDGYRDKNYRPPNLPLPRRGEILSQFRHCVRTMGKIVLL